ncbi:hypothetical protein K431DRAFT_288252 [Polychaeton citri CBS 116435]|uniref:DNA endonuclease activator Ctp1 C-terminal domain-containing protein n=1 Tax=Polychaeton citri CBS 116435 TaxID=1314669 RepID=A0A9P4ULH1_9PEZI|nr:hypothetical protein K431DRAFT_288252 [Polychaeton citri CBS 116435]
MSGTENASDPDEVQQTVLRQACTITSLEAMSEDLNTKIQLIEHQQHLITRLASENDTLRTALQACEQQLEKSHKFVAKAQQRYEAAKKSAREWKAYIDRQRIRDQSRKDATDSHRLPGPSDTDVRPANTVPRTGEEADVTRLSPQALPSDALAAAEESRQNVDIGKVYAALRQITSSQSTEVDEGTSQDQWSPKIKEEPGSNDEPEVLYSRPVKRTRAGPSSPRRRIKLEPASPTVPLESSSDGVSSPKSPRYGLSRFETSDLNAVIDTTVSTPRKRPYVKRDSFRALSDDREAKPTAIHQDGSLSDSDLPESLRIHSNVEPRLANKSGVQDPHVATSVRRKLMRPALQPMSPNVRQTPRVDAGSLKRKRRNPNVSALAEGWTGDECGGDGQGGNDACTSGAPNNHGSAAATSKASRGRLGQILETATHDKQPFPRRGKPKPAKAFEPPRSTLLQGRQNTATPAGSNGQADRPGHAQHKALKKSPLPVVKKAGVEPLRSRPLAQLHAEDFKINPKYMGTSFAFADSLRARDQKKCAVGCTRPGCCGDAFRGLVEAGALRASGKSDAEMFEGYLGSGWEAVVGGYGPERRQELLETARAYALSTEHGKHRQAFERRSTPPGFWDVDFPNTQQVAANRQRADKMQQQQVEQRYLEAMRPNGRWLFRDE